jgi:hypothetical protein
MFALVSPIACQCCTWYAMQCMRGTHMMMVTRRMRYPKIKHVAAEAPVRNTHGAQCAMRGGAHGAQWNYAFEHQHVRWLRLNPHVCVDAHARPHHQAPICAARPRTNTFVERSTHDQIVYIYKCIRGAKHTRWCHIHLQIHS